MFTVRVCVGGQWCQETTAIQWWLDRADFYDTEWFPGIQHFDSWDQLAELSAKVPDRDESAAMRASLETRRGIYLSIYLCVYFSSYLSLYLNIYVSNYVYVCICLCI